MNFFHAVNASISPPASSSVFVTDNLVVRYDMGDPNTYSGSGTTIYDLTANNYDLDESGSPTFTDNHYFAFDGVNDKFQSSIVPTNLRFQGTDTFSIGMWLLNKAVPTSPAYTYLCANQNFGDYDGYSLVTGPPNKRNTFRFWFRTDASNDMLVRADTTFNTNTWYYIVATYDGSQSTAGVKLYVNGVEVSKVVDRDLGTITSVNYTSNTYGLASRSTSAYALCGIGDAHVYDDVLTAQEVAGNYNATKSTYGL